MEEMVLVGFSAYCLLALSPTSRSPSFLKATMDGVVRVPSALAITTGLPPSIAATQLFVVPKSIPIALDIVNPSFSLWLFLSITAKYVGNVIGS